MRSFTQCLRLLATRWAFGWLLLACLLLASLPALAQEPSAEPAEETAAEPAETPAEEGTGSGAGPPPGVEVLRVRGRGLAEIKTEVPSSVTSFDAATIEALGAQDVSDLSRVTPNVNIVQPGATQATFFIRGIGLSDFSSNAAGSVTIFQDDVSLNAPAIQTGQLFDVEGVDIVRGPQGTGPFRNASAGAIRVRSRRPSAGYGASFRLTRGRYHADGGKGAHHGIIQEYEGAVEVPLAEDLLSSRLAFKFRDDEPWKSNGCGNAPPLDARRTRQDANDDGVFGRAEVDFINICGERTSQYIGSGQNSASTIPTGLPSRVGDAHNWAARGIFVLTPPESNWDFTFNAHGSRLDQQSTVGQTIGTFDLLQATNAPELGGFGGFSTSVLGETAYQDPDIADEYFGNDGVSGLCRSDGTNCTNPRAHNQLARRLNHRVLDQRPYRGDYDLVGDTTRDAWGTLVSAESQLGDLDLFVIASYDTYERDGIQDVDFGADPLIFQDSEDEAWQTYEEIRLGGELDTTPFSWEIGAYYLHETLEGRVLNKLTTIEVRRRFEQEIDSAALWWSFGWDFLDDFTLEGGVRLNYERKGFDYQAGGGVIEQIGADPVEDWLEPTGEIILTWHIDERAQAYTRYTRGFKAGHFNSIATARPEELLADPETNDAWEAGLRGGFFDGRLRIAGAFFYYLYENYQVFLFSDVPGNPPSLSIENAKNAELYGVEIEGQLRPLEGWAPRWMEGLRISGNFSWLEGQYIDFTDTLTFNQGGRISTVTFDFSGQPLANSPKYKVSASAEWTFDLGGYGYLIPRYDLAWSDDSFFDARGGQGSPRIDNTPSLPELTIAQPAFFLHGIRLSYRTPTANVEVAGWIRNLTDEVYKSFAFDGSRFAREIIAFTGEPRTMGFDVIFTF